MAGRFHCEGWSTFDCWRLVKCQLRHTGRSVTRVVFGCARAKHKNARIKQFISIWLITACVRSYRSPVPFRFEGLFFFVADHRLRPSRAWRTREDFSPAHPGIPTMIQLVAIASTLAGM